MYFSKTATSRKRLYPNAVPTIFGNCPKAMKEEREELQQTLSGQYLVNGI